MSSAGSDSFTFFLTIWMPPPPFFPLSDAVVRTFDTTLHKNGASGHFCLISDLRGKAFSFSPLNMRLALGLSYMAFIM